MTVLTEQAETEAPEKTDAEKMIEKLRAAIKWLQNHPDVPVSGSIDLSEVGGYMEGKTPKEEAAFVAKAMGKGKKEYDDWFKLTYRIAPGVSYRWFVSHDEVCEKKVVGQRVVDVPAVEAAPATTRTEDVVEWECVGILEGES